MTKFSSKELKLFLDNAPRYNIVSFEKAHENQHSSILNKLIVIVKSVNQKDHFMI